MHHYEWDKVEKEQLNPSLARQVIHGDTMTVARMYLAQRMRGAGAQPS